MDKKPSTMSAATQRLTENGRPATIRRFFSNVIVAAVIATTVDYASADVDDKPITATIRFCRWPSNGDAGACCCCCCCFRRDANDGGQTDSPPLRVVVVVPVRARQPATRFATVRAVLLLLQRQRRARRPLRHGVTLAARAAQCMSDAAAMPCRYDDDDDKTTRGATSAAVADRRRRRLRGSLARVMLPPRHGPADGAEDAACARSVGRWPASTARHLCCPAASCEHPPMS